MSGNAGSNYIGMGNPNGGGMYMGPGAMAMSLGNGMPPMVMQPMNFPSMNFPSMNFPQMNFPQMNFPQMNFQSNNPPRSFQEFISGKKTQQTQTEKNDEDNAQPPPNTASDREPEHFFAQRTKSNLPDISPSTENICSLIADGTAATASDGEGIVFMFHGSKFYKFQESFDGKSLRLVEAQDQQKFDSLANNPVDYVFRVNKYYYVVRGEKVTVYNEKATRQGGLTFAAFYQKFPQLIIRNRKGGKPAYFIAPDVQEQTARSQTGMAAGDYQIEIQGNGQTSTSINNNGKTPVVNYNNWKIPFNFTSYYVSSRGKIIFIVGDKYAISSPFGSRKLGWGKISDLFDCK